MLIRKRENILVSLVYGLTRYIPYQHRRVVKTVKIVGEGLDNGLNCARFRPSGSPWLSDKGPVHFYAYSGYIPYKCQPQSLLISTAVERVSSF